MEAATTASAIWRTETTPVSPSKSGFIFTPSSQTVTVNGANVSGVNFVAQPVVTPTGIQLVQKSVNGNEASATSISASLTSSVTQGNFLIVTGTAARPARTISISDTAGNTYLPAIGPVNEPIQDVNAYIWYVPSAKAGLNTITLTSSAATALEIHISEWSGVSSNLPIDGVASGTGSGTTMTTSSLTTSAAGELVFGYTFAGTSATAGSGFTTLSLINGDPDEFEIQPTSGASVAVTFNQSPGGAWLALMMLVKPAGAISSQLTVAVSQPGAGANLSATTTLSASATDVGSTVTSVQFQVDGSSVGLQL